MSVISVVMFGDPGHANDNRLRVRERFGSFTPGARPRYIWLTILVITLIFASGMAFMLML